jgi:hypothetical protein
MQILLHSVTQLHIKNNKENVMKWIAVLCLMSLNAFAVRVSECPARVSIEATELKPNRSLEQVIRDYGTEGTWGEERAKIVAGYNSVLKTKSIVRTFPLVSARSGKCVYRPTFSHGVPTEEKIEIYTKSGRDMLYLQTDIAEGGVLLRMYANIDELGEDRVLLANEKSGMALAVPRHPYDSYDAGGDLVFIGKLEMDAQAL